MIHHQTSIPNRRPSQTHTRQRNRPWHPLTRQKSRDHRYKLWRCCLSNRRQRRQLHLLRQAWKRRNPRYPLSTPRLETYWKVIPWPVRGRGPDTLLHGEKGEIIDIEFDDAGSVTGDSGDNFIYTVRLASGEVPDIHFWRHDLKKPSSSGSNQATVFILKTSMSATWRNHDDTSSKSYNPIYANFVKSE